MPTIKFDHPYVVWVRCGEGWTAKDFAVLCVLRSIDDVWTFEKFVTTESRELILAYMVVMKEGILPIWEDPQNANGGCWSIKVDLVDSVCCLFEFLILMVSDEITTKSGTVNGFSFSAKNSYNTIIQIWGNDREYNHIKYLAPIIKNNNRFEVICRTHKP
jgi:hypothetical protein